MTTGKDCYHRALPGEPCFTMLARDPEFYHFVMRWAEQRELDVRCGERPSEDMELVEEARRLAQRGSMWRRHNLGAWRRS